MFAFSSELKAFQAIPTFDREVDNNSRAMFFMHGYVPAPHSIFRNIYKLAPGHLLYVDVCDPSSRKVECYWDVRQYYSCLLYTSDAADE